MLNDLKPPAVELPSVYGLVGRPRAGCGDSIERSSARCTALCGCRAAVLASGPPRAARAGPGPGSESPLVLGAGAARALQLVAQQVPLKPIDQVLRDALRLGAYLSV